MIATLQLKIENLTKRFDNGVEALRGVNLEFKAGDFVAVIGPSGSGKSTLLRSINGFVRPSSGQIIFDGTDVSKLNEEGLRAVRKKIAMIFQSFHLIPRHSVLENVLSGDSFNMSNLRTLTGNYDMSITKAALELIKLMGLHGFEYARADQMSGGQQQRVAISRSLLQSPSILLADEPVASLDPTSSLAILNHLRDINRDRNITMIANLHQIDLVREFSKRVIALRDGLIVYDGPTTALDDSWIKKIFN